MSVVNSCRVSCTRMAAALHVGGDHHYLGRYSIEKLHLFERYTRTASRLRVAAVILLTPLPTFLAIVAMDVVPMNPPSAGASENAVAFVRSTVSHAVMTFFTLLPLKQALSLSHSEYSFRTIARIACCTSLTVEAVCIPLAFAWRFPVPFREMIGLPVWMCSICAYNVVFANTTMRRLWRRNKLQTYVPIVGVQLTLFYVFLSLSVGFAYVPLLPQVGMVLVFPLLKVVLKDLVWKYARKLHDVSTDVTICMLEVSGALYQTVCIESITSPWIGVVFLLLDLAQAIHEVRAYVKVDYLGDGRTTLTTALKIVESSVFAATEERAMTSTTRTSTAVASLADALESSRGETATTPFGRRRTRRSTGESMSSTTRGDDVGGRTSEDLPRAIREQQAKLQGQSVVLQSTNLRERRANGKRRRRLLNLDEFQVETPVGWTSSLGRVASTGRADSQGRVASQGRVDDPGNETAVENPERRLSITKSAMLSLQRTASQWSLGHSTGSQRHVEASNQGEETAPTTTESPSTMPTEPPVRILLRAKSSSYTAHTRGSVSHWLFSSKNRRRSAIVTDIASSWPVPPPLTDLNALAMEQETNVAPPKVGVDRRETYLVPPKLPVETPPTGRETSSSLLTTSRSGPPLRPPGIRRRGSGKRKRTSQIVIDGITIPRRDQARILEQTLQLLFASEVLLFAEYMEVVIPLLYAVTIGTEWALPNGKYNLIVMNMTASVVDQQIWTSLLYGTLEVATLLGMYYVMRRKYGVSALYQLAFVLEKYWLTLQGKLVGAFIVVMNAVTVHQGTDFTFQFGAPPPMPSGSV